MGGHAEPVRPTCPCKQGGLDLPPWRPHASGHTRARSRWARCRQQYHALRVQICILRRGGVRAILGPEFLVVRDLDTKKWVQRRYLHFTKERFRTLVDSLDGVDTPHAWMLRTVMHLAEHLPEMRVPLFVCGHRNWPVATPPEQRVGRAFSASRF